MRDPSSPLGTGVVLLLWAIGTVALSTAGCRGGDAPGARTSPSPAWELVWADEFEASQLDSSSWTAEVVPDPHNEELQYYTDRTDQAPGANAWLEDGHLVIEARREDHEHRRYTSARLETAGKREFLYGRFEARMRLPDGVGMWPAFWLLGANIGAVGWPVCGEIDVMEGKGRLPNWTSGAIHGGPDPGHNRIVAGNFLLPSGDFHDAWHVFSVEWRPDRIEWRVDETPFFEVTKPAHDDPADWPFDHGHPFYLILNLAVGGWFDQPHLPPDDMQPQRLLVDYVRVYRETG
ncbi:MAG TPA: glycoside hydrolase family 16 protein [Thermoanaerobaculia bacterium]|nr:glycoside hydrolase family 16 protein [Thermoanaerobaculia bacterium]